MESDNRRNREHRLLWLAQASFLGGLERRELKRGAVDVLRAHRRIGTLQRGQQVQLVRLLDDALLVAGVRGQEHLRVGVIKLLVAALPTSWWTLEGWLRPRQVRHIYEVHFTIFAILDSVYEFPDLQRLAPRAATLAYKYLMTATTDRGHAAWMAGDLLGDHSPLGLATRFLSAAALTAVHPAGRLGALHGIAHLYSRSGRLRPGLKKVLADASRDSSPRVRARAADIVSGRDPCL